MEGSRRRRHERSSVCSKLAPLEKASCCVFTIYVSCITCRSVSYQTVEESNVELRMLSSFLPNSGETDETAGNAVVMELPLHNLDETLSFTL